MCLFMSDSLTLSSKVGGITPVRLFVSGDGVFVVAGDVSADVMSEEDSPTFTLAFSGSSPADPSIIGDTVYVPLLSGHVMLTETQVVTLFMISGPPDILNKISVLLLVVSTDGADVTVTVG